LFLFYLKFHRKIYCKENRSLKAQGNFFKGLPNVPGYLGNPETKKRSKIWFKIRRNKSRFKRRNSLGKF
jgi:hypothetical protein